MFKKITSKFSKLGNNALLLNSLWTLFARFTGVALNFSVILLITNTLSKSLAGDLLLLMTFITGIALISRLGIDQYLMKEVASAHDANALFREKFLSICVKATLLLSVIFMVLWLLFSSTIQQKFFSSDGGVSVSLIELLSASAGILFFNLVIINSTYLKAIKKSVVGVLGQNALTAITFLALIIVFWRYFSKEQFTIYLYVLSLVLAGVISVIATKKLAYGHSHAKSIQSNMDINSVKDTPPLFSIIRKSLPYAPISIISFLMIFTDTIMVGWYLPNEQVAEYSVASRVSYIILFFLQAMEATIYPRLLNMFKHDNHNIRGFFWQSTALVVVVVLCVTFFMYFLSDWILLAFGSEYVIAKNALVILLVAQFLRAASITFSFMFIIREQVKYLNIILVVAFITNVICNIIFIQNIGIDGAAYATLLANAVLLSLVLLLFYAKKLLNIEIGKSA